LKEPNLYCTRSFVNLVSQYNIRIILTQKLVTKSRSTGRCF